MRQSCKLSHEGKIVSDPKLKSALPTRFTDKDVATWGALIESELWMACMTIWKEK